MRRLPFALLFATFALASCGGGDDTENVQELLDKAFSSSMDSADLRIDASVQLQGSPGLERPLRLSATGPFRTNTGKLPSADIELRIGTDGGGQTVTTGFLSTGDRAFLRFQDVYYEQPADEVRRANRAIRDNQGRRGSLRGLGLDPRSWLAEATDEGEEEIGGVATRHVSGTLDVEAVMRNLNEFVRRSGAALGGATGQPPPEPLSDEDIARVGEVVRDPIFHVYVGEEDDIIRRVSGRIEFEVPAASREELGGLESGSIEFEVEFTDVNGDQRIEPPANARPISDLTQSLGGGGPLPGLGGESASPSVPDEGGEASPEEEAFRAYEQCLDRAAPEDTEALQRCAELLE